MQEKNVKNCLNCKKKFLIIAHEETFYKRKNLPLPLECPECRRDKRRSIRNKRKLYKRTCDKCKADLISTYEKDSPFIVYCEKCYLETIN
jgi:hypothetical protein